MKEETDANPIDFNIDYLHMKGFNICALCTYILQERKRFI